MKCLETEQKSCSDLNRKSALEVQIKQLEIANTIHKKKAQSFYDRKRVATQTSKSSVHKEAICFDFGRNLPIPNVSTNDVYYKRQLSLYAFNITVLSSGESFFLLIYRGCW